MMRLVKGVVFAALVSIALGVLAFTWLITTTSGFQYAIEVTQRYVPELKIAKAEGRLIGTVSLTDIRYAVEQGPLVTIDSVSLRWQSMALLRGTAKIDDLHISQLHVVERDTADSPKTPTEQLDISLPIAIEIDSLTVDSLKFTTIEGDAVSVFNHLSSQLYLRHSSLSLTTLAVERDELQLQLAGVLDINPPYAMQLATNIHLNLPDLPTLGFTGNVAGDSDLLRVQQTSQPPLAAELDLELSQLLGQIGWQLDLKGGHWQLADFVGEQTLQIGGLSVSAAGDLQSIDGTVQFDVHQQDVPDIALVTEFSSYGFDDWLVDIRAGIDNSSEVNLAGRVNALLTGKANVDVAGDWSDIRWPYSEAAPLLKQSQGRFSVNGVVDSLLIDVSASAELTGDAQIPDQQLQLEGRIQASLHHAVIEQLELASDLGRLTARGHIDWAEQLRVSLDSNWHEIRIPETLSPVSIRSPQGSLQLRADDNDFVLSSDMSLLVDQQPLQLTLTGDGDLSGFERFELLLAQAGASAAFAGTIAWQERISVAGDFTLEDVNPGILLSDWQGRLDGQGQLGFRLEDEQLHLSASKVHIEGELRELPVLLQSELSYQDSVLDIPKLVLSSGGSSIHVQGKMTDVFALEWQLDSPDLSDIYPQLVGQFSATGVLSGDTTNPNVTAQLQAQAVSWQDYALGQLTADISVSEGGAGELYINTQLNNLKFDAFALEQVSLNLSGALAEHILSIQAQAADALLDSVFVGSLRDEIWQGTIDRLSFDSEISGLWQLSEAGDLMLSASAVTLSQHCWRSREYGQLCLQAQSDPQRNWQASGNFAEFPVAVANPFIHDFAELAGQLTGKFQLAAEAGAMPTGLIQLELDQGSVKLSEAIFDQEQPVTFEIVTLQVNMTQQQTTLNFLLQPDIDGVAALDLSATTADLTTVINTPNQAALSGALTMSIADLAVLNLGSAAYDDLTGRLSVDARFSGDMATPQLDAEILLAEAAVELITLGILMTDINAQISGDMEGFALTFSARSGEGELNGAGEFNLAESGWQLHAKLDAEQFELVNLPEAYVIASSALGFEATADALSIRGDVSIPTAELAPMQFNSTVSLSDDVVVLGRDHDGDSRRMSTHIDANVSFGDAVRLTAMGFNGRLTGQLRVRGDPNTLLQGNGEIVLTDGSYDAYGQQLRVNDGRIVFANSAIDNPDLDIRAVRTGTDFTAGIRVYGPADNPQASLFSTPTMSQDNILSHILLGRPLLQANDSDAAFLATAATGLGIRNGAMIGEQIASSFGLDSFSVSGDTPETTAVEIGKFLSPRLYVSYGIGVFEPISTMQLRYTLSRLFTLRAESGIETGVDLLYTYERR